MSVVVISFLLKKYIEVRVQHQELRAKYEGLVSSCRGDPYARHFNDKKDNVCSCPGFDARSSFHSQTHDLPKNTQVHYMQHQPSTTRSELYMSDSQQSRELLIDDFGRTAGYVAKGRSIEAPSSESMTSESSTEWGPQLLPLVHDVPGRQTVVQPSFTSDVEVFFTELPQNDITGHHFNDKTDWNDDITMQLQSSDSTSESVGQVRLSPSMDSSNSHLPSHSFGHTLEHEMKSGFYFGSSPHKRANEREQLVAVTEVTEGNLGGWSGVVDESVSKNEQNDIMEDLDQEMQEDELKLQPLPTVSLLKLSEREIKELSMKGTSAVCVGHTVSERACNFKNLCFNTYSQDFVILHSNQSSFVNLPAHDENPVLLELSTVAGHNGHHFSYVDIPAKELKQFNVYLVPNITVIFARFKPDNIMHVFHDDIIPLLHTLHGLKLKPATGSGKFPVALFLADKSGGNDFLELYEVLVNKDVFTMESLQADKSERLVCFEEAQVGLSKATVWYQYGFFKPQGHLNTSQVLADHIRNVSSHFLHYFSNECVFCGMGKYMVLIVRKETRLIVNEMELVTAITQEFRVKVMTVSLETHSVADMMPIIHHSMGIVGMHGSLLSMAIFLQPGSFLVELFPLNINPSRYVPYKTLCEIPGMNIIYRAWVNKEPHNSISHPERPPELGGIHHLPVKSQQVILAQTEVPDHLCCEDPSWLYHIFQDTVLNIPQVLDVIRSAVQEAKKYMLEKQASSRVLQNNAAESHEKVYSMDHRSLYPDADDRKQALSNSQLVPGPTHHPSCKLELYGDMNAALTVRWQPPWNLGLILGKQIEYNILVQDSNSEEHFSVSVGNMNEYRISEGIKARTTYRVWVRCILDGVEGPYSSMTTCD